MFVFDWTNEGAKEGFENIFFFAFVKYMLYYRSEVLQKFKLIKYVLGYIFDVGYFMKFSQTIGIHKKNILFDCEILRSL